MRFALTDEQRGFARSLDDLLAASGTAATARAWASGDHDPGLKLARRLSDLGVTGLLVPEAAGGLDASAVEMVVALEALGRHAVPGPWVEAAFVTALLTGLPGLGGREDLLAAICDGSAVPTAAAPPRTPYALDADVATHVFLVEGGTLHEARPLSGVRSVDPVRRLFGVAAGPRLADVPAHARTRAHDTAALACAAQLLGLGEALLDASVGHVKQRRQFGRAVGEYQALKHALADVRIGLDFARPLVLGAAVTGSSRDVSAAKVGASDAAYRAARTALQVHGALGYTAELDLSLWLLKVRTLVGAWGSPGDHRERVLRALLGQDRGA